ncbi:hypothetical protein [Streptomyces sp. NPDC090029]|uniref:hypothetical protein n=1 Tax=Streptomyces sp. NPDC090029 TaxID=3365924 RepID=UPI0038294B53
MGTAERDRGRRGGLRAEDAARLRAAVERSTVVNLTGPPGIGKSTLLARLLADAPGRSGPRGTPGTPGTAGVREPAAAVVVDLARPDRPPVPEGTGGLLILDGADGPGRTAEALDALGTAPRRLLVVSRRPLAAVEGWTGRVQATVALAPLPEPEVANLAAEAGIEDPAARALVVHLSGGVPLLAGAACRALHAGAEPGDEGAVADQVAGELTERLARELPGTRWQHALRLLATVGSGDEQLLSAGPELFTRLGALSVVRRTPLGLAVREPYRTVLETAYRWRRPLAHHSSRSRAAAYRGTLLARAGTPAARAALVREGLFLNGDATLRGMLFPAAESPVRVAPAHDGDADDIGRLLHGWARRGGFDGARAERITEGWLAHGTSAFRLARDADGRARGLSALLPLGAATADAVEPVLQQHTEHVAAAPRAGGLFLGAAYATEPAAHARILHDILTDSVLAGHLVVSTATADYQRLVRGMGFRLHGSVREDVYRCGRRPEVFSHAFAPASLPLWLERLGGRGAGPGEHLVAGVTRALRHLGDDRALAGSGLPAGPATSTPAALREWLREAVYRLAESGDPVDAEAGAVLAAYYLGGPATTHHQVAGRLHLGRATYFRRLRRGVTAIAAALGEEAAASGR